MSHHITQSELTKLSYKPVLTIEGRKGAVTVRRSPNDAEKYHEDGTPVDDIDRPGHHWHDLYVTVDGPSEHRLVIPAEDVPALRNFLNDHLTTSPSDAMSRPAAGYPEVGQIWSYHSNYYDHEVVYVDPERDFIVVLDTDDNTATGYTLEEFQEAHLGLAPAERL